MLLPPWNQEHTHIRMQDPLKQGLKLEDVLAFQPIF